MENKLPKLHFTKEAREQIALIQKMDHTLKDKYFRIQISGKGCYGFDYSTGFTYREEQDHLLDQDSQSELKFLLDPFTAFYLREATIDYKIDLETNRDGFTVVNHQEDLFQGKFWQQNSDQLPELPGEMGQ